MPMQLNPFRAKPVFDANTQVSITEQGKAEIDGDMVRGASWQVLATLDQHSPRTVSNIARETRQDLHRTSKTVQMLRQQQLVRVNDFSGD